MLTARVVRAANTLAVSSVKRNLVSSAEPVHPQPDSGISWKTVTLGVTATGLFGSGLAFFSDRAHKDNEITRRELREDMKALENRMDKRFDELRDLIKEKKCVHTEVSTPSSKMK